MHAQPSTLPATRSASAPLPRFERDHEPELARAVVRARRAYWAILLSPTHLEMVLDTIVERARDAAVVALATRLRASLEHASPEAPGIGLQELADALDRVGDEHAASDAIVARAARVDASWRRDAEQARTSYLAARNRFVRTNLRLVTALANQFGSHLMPVADRIQEGNIGLVKAVDRFDPERGVRFCTYACWWIRHAIMRALSTYGRTVRVPSQLHVLFAKAERARPRLSSKLGREPDVNELAAAVGCRPERLEWAQSTVQTRSVSFDGQRDGGLDVSDVLDDEASLTALEDIGHARDRERAREALRDLSAREQDILHERCGFPGASLRTLKEIGRRHGVSRECVRQLEQKALEQLRRKLEPPRGLGRLVGLGAPAPAHGCAPSQI